MEEVSIKSGSQIKLKRVDDSDLPVELVTSLQELAHREESVEAIYLFAIQPHQEDEQISVAVAIKHGLFRKPDEEFLRLVGEIQILLPEDFPVNLYRLESSPPVARYCLENVEPIYLRSTTWRDKMLKKYERKG